MDTESTKKSRGHSFFVLFFTFYIKIMKKHEKARKSTKKHEKALKSKLGVFLMDYGVPHKCQLMGSMAAWRPLFESMLVPDVKVPLISN